MCNDCVARGRGWRGWNDIPQRQPGTPLGEWIDLTHPINPSMPNASIFPMPEITLLREMPGDPFNVTQLRMVVHAGTHLDTPRHYYLDGPACEDVPFDRLHGPGTVVHIPASPGQILGADLLEGACRGVQPGDILAIDTGWSAFVGTETYGNHPSFDADAADWFVARGIKMLACDFATPDLVYSQRQPGFDWPVHRALLSRGILICENLRIDRGLAGKRLEFTFGMLNIVGSDGSPVRAFARHVNG